MNSEKEYAKKRKSFIIIGILFLIIGFGLFLAGPILFIVERKFYLFFINFFGVFFMIPGFFLITLGSARAIAEFQTESIGPVAVKAAHKYGRPIAREVAGGIKDGLTGENSEMYCKYCGNRIDIDSDFCKYCGKKQN